MHEVARTLEDPFVHPPNHLPAMEIQEEFNSRILAAWDGARISDGGDTLATAAERPVCRLLESRARRRIVHSLATRPEALFDAPDPTDLRAATQGVGSECGGEGAERSETPSVTKSCR